jgi:hypothetical protein
MKTKLMLIVIAGVLITGCDFYKEDVPAVIDYTMDYFPNEPIAVDLSAFIEPERSKSFKLRGLPGAGSAEIISESFLIYEPKGGKSDQVIVDVFDANNEKIGEARVNLEGNASACGIAQFDYAEVPPGGELLINLLKNDSICSPIRSTYLSLRLLENYEGLTFPPIDPKDPSTWMKLGLYYKAPEGFKGTVRAFYKAGVNVKDEYRDLSGEELMENPVEKFEYFVTSLVEIKVE